MLLKPNADESQSAFAIRFHESAEMQGQFPRTSDRNDAMMDQWDKYGSDFDREVGDRVFDADKYEAVRNVAIFAEHRTMDRVLPNGKTLPAQVYDRDRLVAIANRQNYSIRDVEQFPPIVEGHTSDSPDGKEPARLGFSGAARLGMIGNENPRWAIFTDEYRRHDAKDRLDACPNRSVEVLISPSDPSKSFFWPVAALGNTPARLSMPATRYSARDNEEFAVDRYSVQEDEYLRDVYMAMPGGSNTAVPQHQKYGFGNQPDDLTGAAPMDQGGDRCPACNAAQGLPEDQQRLDGIMQALVESPIGQQIIQMLEREGQAGAVSPMVSQPPEQVEMPMEDNPQAQMGQQGMPPGGGMPPGMGGDMSGQPNGGQPPQSPGGQQFPPQKGNSPMNGQNGNQPPVAGGDQQKDQYSILQGQVADLQNQLIQRDRYSALENLAQTKEFDVAAEMELTASYSAEQFDAHCGIIRDRYQDRVTAPGINVAGLSGAGQAPAAAAHAVDSQSDLDLSAEEVAGISAIAGRYSLDWDSAVDKYREQEAVKQHGEVVAG